MSLPGATPPRFPAPLRLTQATFQQTTAPKTVNIIHYICPQMNDQQWDHIIKPKGHLFDLKMREVLRYKDLLMLFVKRDIVVNYKQTILGPLWFFIQPILTTIIFVVVFGNIAGLSTDEIPQPLFYLAGIVIWNYFSECFTKTSNIFSQNAQVFGKVYFPRLITPLSLVISNGLKFLIQLGLFLALYAYFFLKGTPLGPNWTLVFLPVLILLMALLGLGFGLIFSSLTTKYKDLNFLIQFGVQLLMYATPVIYPMSSIPEKYQVYIAANPLSHVVEGFKYMFFGQGTISLGGLLYTGVFTLVVLLLGIVVFNRTERSFMDTV
jgi:lipopolysaccharide transport system permease protein